jgi:phosphatidylglycerophosphate synthase
MLARLGHALTASRVAVAPAIGWWIVDGRLGLASAALLAAMASDLLDGPLVRRFGRPTRIGAWFDIGADLLLVSAAFAGLAIAGVLAWWPLWAIGASFAVFAATARRRLYDPLGRSIGGVLMVAALAVLVTPDFAAQQVLGAAASIACAMTMGARLASVRQWATQLSERKANGESPSHRCVTARQEIDHVDR